MPLEPNLPLHLDKDRRGAGGAAGLVLGHNCSYAGLVLH
jgi:hypothetical protein